MLEKVEVLVVLERRNIVEDELKVVMVENGGRCMFVSS